MTQPAIAYPEMQKSILVLYDMVAFYLPLHGQGWKEFFTYYPILGMVEGLIYQVEVAMDASESADATRPNLWPRSEPLITAFLAEHKLLKPAILHYLAEVGHYFQMVHHLLTTNQPTHADIIRAAETRPADIRLLHAILLHLMGQAHDEANDTRTEKALFDLLWPLEVLLDLKANLTEYADDLVTGHYNTYQMFVKLYGEQAPHYIEIEQQRYQSSLQEKLAGASIENQRRLQQFMAQHEADYPSVSIPMPVTGLGDRVFPASCGRQRRSALTPLIPLSQLWERGDLYDKKSTIFYHFLSVFSSSPLSQSWERGIKGVRASRCRRSHF